MESVVERVTKRSTEREDKSTHHRYLLIYTNVDALEYDENKEELSIGKSEFKLPHELLENVKLKPHQEAGLKWLQLNYLLNRRGCLLADDMGLGKTLQVLMFLSWLIERGDISPERADKERSPWSPILIVAPVMLLENETWINDMRTFFKGEGCVFEPNIVLHGSELQRHRLQGIAGRETEIEKPVLDLERLRNYRVVLTNYETITNYQYSFAMMKDNWSVVVTDEAQEYKTANSKISHALKSLFPRFRIACTGTPVETKLTDVWNIFDFLQPGLLGSASDFRNRFENPIRDGNETNLSTTLQQLREHLLFGKTSSYVLRRDKDELKRHQDFPEKYEHKLYCDLSEEQREKHIDFVERARSGGEGNHPFSMIHHLMKLYQHPALLLKEEIGHSEEVLKRCPKFMKVIDELKKIQDKNEKVLIFTRSLDMQQLLANVISEKFGIHAEIINGGTKRYKGTISGNNTRKAIVERFRNRKGFNVIILSPDVAGIGLTLTEANHVIHYGRWWNPAKESQATDRVYRIGQTKEVHVYYPIARDPKNVFKTFDEKLDALIDRRKKLATDFLLPMPGEDDLGKELWEDIFREDNGGGSAKALSKEDIRLLPWDRFESLIALIEQKRGRKVILTPRSGDYGIDVISILGTEVKLIQCKHTCWDANVDIDVVVETINAFDSYRGRWLHGIANRMNLKALLITNGKYTRAAKSHASVSDVQILSDNDLWPLLEDKPCTLGEIEVMENRRMASMRDVQREINRL
jgi:SNF2 family DNA or RNA helicase